MKELYYRFGKKDEVVTLTDSEFTAAMLQWDQNKPYFCERKETLCPPNPFARTPKDEYGRGQILVDPLEDHYYRYVLGKNNTVFMIDSVKSDNTSDLIKINMPDWKRQRLVSQDEYFDNLEKYSIERDKYLAYVEEKKKQLESPKS